MNEAGLAQGRAWVVVYIYEVGEPHKLSFIVNNPPGRHSAGPCGRASKDCGVYHIPHGLVRVHLASNRKQGKAKASQV